MALHQWPLNVAFSLPRFNIRSERYAFPRETRYAALRVRFPEKGSTFYAGATSPWGSAPNPGLAADGLEGNVRRALTLPPARGCVMGRPIKVLSRHKTRAKPARIYSTTP
jgi:hypothetical protein